MKATADPLLWLSPEALSSLSNKSRRRTRFRAWMWALGSAKTNRKLPLKSTEPATVRKTCFRSPPSKSTEQEGISCKNEPNWALESWIIYSFCEKALSGFSIFRYDTLAIITHLSWDEHEGDKWQYSGAQNFSLPLLGGAHGNRREWSRRATQKKK